MDSKITRRQLLVTTGTIAVAGLASAEGSLASTEGSAAATEGSAARLVEKAPLTFLDGLLSADEIAMGKRELAPHQPEALKLDLVWEWRGELQSHIARGGKLVAITRWDKALLFNELAREAGFAVRQERIAGSLFRTDIAPGARG